MYIHFINIYKNEEYIETKKIGYTNTIEQAIDLHRILCLYYNVLQNDDKENYVIHFKPINI